MTYDDPAKFNAVTVRVPRRAEQNGEVPLMFARALGVNSFAAEATATAVILSDIKGFESPLSGEKVPILPFAFDLGSWDAMLAGNGTDDWKWDEQSGQTVSGSDGIPELNLYPQDTGMPGNRGTVNIGTTNNGTSTIERQIVDGVSSEDLDYHGGSLELNDQLELSLEGSPGISAGFQDELTSIIGEARIVPVYDDVTGSGDKATFTIVKWVGIRIVEVVLTGNNKRVIAQPAEVPVNGGIANTAGSGASEFIYSPIWLAR